MYVVYTTTNILALKMNSSKTVVWCKKIVYAHQWRLSSLNSAAQSLLYELCNPHMIVVLYIHIIDLYINYVMLLVGGRGVYIYYIYMPP